MESGHFDTAPSALRVLSLKPPPVGREGVAKEPILAEPLFPETDGMPVRNARVGGTSSVSLRQHPNLAISTLHWFYIITTLLMWQGPRRGGAVATARWRCGSAYHFVMSHKLTSRYKWRGENPRGSGPVSSRGRGRKVIHFDQRHCYCHLRRGASVSPDGAFAKRRHLICDPPSTAHLLLSNGRYNHTEYFLTIFTRYLFKQNDYTIVL